MQISQVKHLLADRMAERATQYTKLFSGPLDIAPRDFAPAYVARVEASHALMDAYTQMLIERPLQVENLTLTFLDDYIQILNQGLPETEDAQWDAYFAVAAMRGVSFCDNAGEAVDALREFLDITCGPLESAIMDTGDESFWALMEAMCLSIQPGLAAQLIESATGEKPAPLPQLAELLRRFPSGSAERPQFWEWRKSMLALLQACQTLPLPWGPRLSRVVAILTGRSDSVGHWTQAVCCQFAYYDPDPQQWPTYIKGVPQAQQALQGDAADWECAVARAMDGRNYSAILNLQSLDGTTAIVLAEFFFRLNKLQSPFASTPSLREYLGLCHALDCIECPTLGTIGLDLLINMDTPYAREILAAAIPKLGLEAPETRQEALELCKRFGLVDSARALYEKIAQYEQPVDILESLKNYYLADNIKGMIEATWTAFEGMLVSGSPLALPSSPAGLAQQVAECLAPLVVLAKVLRDESDEIDENVELLLKSGLVPGKYIPLIVAYCSDVVANSHTLAVLMRALCDWEKDPQGLELLNTSRRGNSSWARGIDEGYTSAEVIKMLHRKLADVLYSV